MGFWRVAGHITEFVVCGAVGGAIILSTIPELRKNCSGGIVCSTLRFLTVLPAPDEAIKIAATASPQTKPGCLTKSDRVVLYRLSVILTGATSTADQAPASLGLGSNDCMPIETVAAVLCTSLGSTWTTASMLSCEFGTPPAESTKISGEIP
jgi:hypothetical protein